MKTLQERMNDMKPYFRGIEMYNEALIVRVVFPPKWKAYNSNDGRIKAAPSENVANEYYYYANSENTTYIEDRPKPEKMDEKIVHIIKNILFGKINIKNNEREILKLLSDCQEKADKIKDIQKQFFIRQDDIYNSVMDLKENIAYYSL